MVHKKFFSIEEDFITWREKFWPTVCEHFGVQATGDQVRYIKLSHIDQSLIYSISVNMTNIKTPSINWGIVRFEAISYSVHEFISYQKCQYQKHQSLIISSYL